MNNAHKPRQAAAVLLAGTLLFIVGAAPDDQRHVVEGHFNVFHPRAAGPLPTGTGLVTNFDFETSRIDRGWYQCGDVPAYTTKQHPYRGAYDEYSGTASGVGEPQGNSGVCQLVMVPPGAMLTAQLYQLSNEPDTRYGYQEADLLDDRGSVVVNLYKTVNNAAAWVRGTWNLAAYAGRAYWLYFGVHGDGYVKHSTQQFLDDVILVATATPTPSPSPSSTPSTAPASSVH
jgi:hypothetical protein